MNLKAPTPQDKSSSFFYMKPIIDSVCNLLRITEAEFYSKKRQHRMAEARQIASWFARRYTPLTLQEIGDMLGHRDHTTILYGVKCIDDRLMVDEWTKNVVIYLDAEIKKKLKRKS